MGNELIPYQFPASNIHYNLPDFSNPYMKQKTMNEIKNSWNKIASLDNFGRVWVAAKGIHVLLRTTPDYAKYYIGGIRDEYKFEVKDDVLIKGEVIYSLLDRCIQSAGQSSRENYLRYSEMFYRAIRDCDYAKNIRNEFNCFINNEKPKLKKRRIIQYLIKYDELTNEKLNINKCEFSHIRSAALYPVIATYIENGLIVNKSTHQLITSEGIGDEIQLYTLCIEKRWNTDWYDHFTKCFSRLSNST